MVGFINKILHFNPRFEVRIDQDACTGCGKCFTICPQMFSMEESVAVIIDHTDPKPFKKACKKAADACALGAIIIQ